MDFALEDLSIAVGTTVTWANVGNAPHTTTAGVPGDLSGEWDSPTLPNSDRFSFTFDRVGTFSYFCRIHPFMTGTVNVVEEQASMPAATPVAGEATPTVGGYDY